MGCTESSLVASPLPSTAKRRAQPQGGQTTTTTALVSASNLDIGSVVASDTIHDDDVKTQKIKDMQKKPSERIDAERLQNTMVEKDNDKENYIDYESIVANLGESSAFLSIDMLKPASKPPTRDTEKQKQYDIRSAFPSFTTDDVRWEYLFRTLSPRILDPMDMHSTLDAMISTTINRLTPAEVSFVKRRVKIAMRSIMDGGEIEDNMNGGKKPDGGGGGDGTGSASGLLRKRIKLLTHSSPLTTGVTRLLQHGTGIDPEGEYDNDLVSSQPFPLDASVDRSRETYRRERLLDIVAFRKIFEGVGKSLREQVRTSASRASSPTEATEGGSEQRRPSLKGTSTKTPPASPARKAKSTPTRHNKTNKVALDHFNTTEEDATNDATNSLSRSSSDENIAEDMIDVYGSAYLLLLYMSESRWEYVAEIAKLSANETGLIMDVNKLALLNSDCDDKDAKAGETKKDGCRWERNDSTASVPPPPGSPSSLKPPSEIYGEPRLTTIEPMGVHFSSLCFLLAMALRGTRRQKVNLLFYLLLPPKELYSLLISHPAGGFPTWLLEVDGDVVLSYESLNYFYNYDGVMLPSVDNVGDYIMTSYKKKRLSIDSCDSVEVLATLLADSLGVRCYDSQDGNSGVYGKQLLMNLKESNNDKTKVESINVQSSLMDLKCEKVSTMLIRATLQDGEMMTTTSADLSSIEMCYIDKFIEMASSFGGEINTENEAGRSSWSMKEFSDWVDVAMDDVVLDKIMSRLFGTGIIPTAQMEYQLVAQRWIDWNTHNEPLDDSSPPPPISHEMNGHTAPASTSSMGGIRRMFVKSHDSEVPIEEMGKNVSENFNHVWGGIGGVDGKGGFGHGVLYCIDKCWWDEWAAFTGWRNDVTSTTNNGPIKLPEYVKRPRELTTERLIDRSPDSSFMSGSQGSYEAMKSSVVNGEDYVLVPPGVWNILYEMYGGGPPLPRMVLPPKSCMTGGDDGGGLSSVEVIVKESERVIHPYPAAIPPSVRVATHPWVIHCQICDPRQPYRRGDAGPMSIRLMAMPDQPMWRLFGEIVVRLPISSSCTKTKDGEKEGRARLWKFETKASPTVNQYGPWALLCKNLSADIPVGTSDIQGGTYSYQKYQERWDKYADWRSVESIGITDGMRLLYECTVVNKDGSFTWPREAAAKATAARRIADEDANFRLFLRGLDAKSEPLKTLILRTIVDAMDSTGCWYQAIIVNVDTTTKAGDAENDNSTANGSAAKTTGFGEYTHVRVHFNVRGGNHEEWIDVKSDRLAVRGRMTSSSVKNLEIDSNGDEVNSSNESKTKSATGNKKKETTETSTFDHSNNAVCLFPSYGACGLMNLGNTCYANSGWQCMSYLPLLRAYLLSEQFKMNGDINKDNPLGTGGKILEEFSELLHFMWSGKYGSRAPQKFRAFLAKSRSQYSGADQQDAQELLNDMFDMLHEDGNRVKRKYYVEALEDKFIERSELSRVGQEAWRRFLRRNRSAITDLSMGQVYNRVTCPVCNHSSKNFDPFNMLSLPFPTVTEVIFQCTVVRRATDINCPNTLARRSQKDKASSRVVKSSPPSKDLIFEEYLIPMSRLADVGDLKMKLQQLCGVLNLRICKKEVIESTASDDSHAFTKMYTKVVLLPDKEGPCLRHLGQETFDGVTSQTIASIIAFETTLRVRSIEPKSSTNKDVVDDASTTSSELSNDSERHAIDRDKKDYDLAREYLRVYGDEKECVSLDTNPLVVAKVISRNLWPRSDIDFTLGLRVDAIDHRNHWFPGSVIEIINADEIVQALDEEGGGARNQSNKKVKIHFDNFSAKWDETYSIDSFTEGRVCPLYSYAPPRPKPTEFVVHHRGLDQKSNDPYLFGQSFYVQCHNEWSTARAGAHILAQASRFLEDPITNANETTASSISKKERHNAQKMLSRVIEALVTIDKQYVQAAVNIGQETSTVDKHAFVTSLSNTLSTRLREVLPLLPFEVRVTTAVSPLGTNDEDKNFPYSLVRTIGNYMNARHALVLHWHQRKDDPNSRTRHPTQLLYTPPSLVPHPQSHALLDTKQKDQVGVADDKSSECQSSPPSQGWLHIGACLTEFCKEQQLDANGSWRCPQCKVDREAKQSMTLWNLPDLLTFHLKRFSASSRWREKISTRVDCPLTGLNMREWCDKDSPLCRESNDETFIYDLVGVINHIGGMTGGHYIAICKATTCSPDGEEEVAYNFNGANITDTDTAETCVEDGTTPNTNRWHLGRSKEKHSATNAATKLIAESAEPLWLQFDDDLVEPIPPRNVVSETSYVLFYRRRRCQPANIAKYMSLG